MGSTAAWIEAHAAPVSIPASWRLAHPALRANYPERRASRCHRQAGVKEEAVSAARFKDAPKPLAVAIELEDR